MRQFRPAATCIVLRDTPSGIQTLMLQRNAALALHGGLWVFPGGGVAEEDYDPGDMEALASFGRAAVRETEEEAGLCITTDALTLSARWFTPSSAPRQYDTRFFAARAPAGQAVRIDNGEICDYRWASPRCAVDEHQRGVFRVPPPTFLTLLRLSDCVDVTAALAALSEIAHEEYRPRIVNVGGTPCILYSEDAGYGSRRPDLPGGRHRLWLTPGRWQYDRLF